MHRLSGIVAALVVLLGTAHSSAQDRTLTVFAAASMKNALDDIDAAYTAKTGVKVTVSDVNVKGGQETVHLIEEQGGEAAAAAEAEYRLGKRLVVFLVCPVRELSIACFEYAAESGPAAEAQELGRGPAEGL